MACTAPLTYKGQAALKTDLDNLKDALKGVEPRRRVRAVHLAGQHRGLERKQILQDRRGIPDRHRRRDERRIQGDRRCGLPGAGRRSAAGQLLPDGAEDVGRRHPQMGDAAGRGAQSCAARHPDRENPLPHLLQHQHGSARARPRGQAHHRHPDEDPRRRLLVRSVQSAPRARMGGVEGGEAAGGHGADPGRHHQLVGAGRASRAGRAADRPLCRFHGARERHRRNRLRICEFCRLRRGPRQHRLGQVRCAGEGRGDRQQEALVS